MSARDALLPLWVFKDTLGERVVRPIRLSLIVLSFEKRNFRERLL